MLELQELNRGDNPSTNLSHRNWTPLVVVTGFESAGNDLITSRLNLTNCIRQSVRIPHLNSPHHLLEKLHEKVKEENRRRDEKNEPCLIVTLLTTI